jgi:sulfofructose kinase
MDASRDFDVLGLGVVAVDDLLYVDDYPVAGEKVRVNRRERQCGGLTGTALVAAARLGSRCGYVGTLGDDEASRAVAVCFDREGIDLAHAVRRPDARPGRSTIIVDCRQKTRTVFSHVEGHFGPDPDRPGADVIRRAAVLLVDHHGVAGTFRATRIARDAGIGVVADFERDPGGAFDELLALVDHLVVPERFARQLSGAATAEEACRRLWTPDRQAVVVTCGEQGCWYCDSPTAARPEHLSAFAVEVADTTGCGDVFHGAYCAGLAEGMTLGERLRLASATAALKATACGGQSGIPTREAVDAFLARPGGTP